MNEHLLILFYIHCDCKSDLLWWNIAHRPEREHRFWEFEIIPINLQYYNHNYNRKLKICTVHIKVKSQEPAYSQVLN